MYSYEQGPLRRYKVLLEVTIERFWTLHIGEHAQTTSAPLSAYSRLYGAGNRSSQGCQLSAKSKATAGRV